MSVEINLPFAEYHFLFRAKDTVYIPSYSGSMWRGAFGHALKEFYCCGEKSHTKDCIYSALFEPMPDHYQAFGLRKKQNPPRSILFKSSKNRPNVLKERDLFSFSLILVGSSNQKIAMVIEGVSKALHQGIGKGKGAAELQEVSVVICNKSYLIYKDENYFKIPETSAFVYQPTSYDLVKVRLVTPLCVKTKAELEPSLFLMNIIRRISLLQRCYTSNEVDYDFAYLKQLSTQVHMQKEVHLTHWKRWSERQKKVQMLYGWMGELTFSGDALTELLPFLHLGQWLHTGKMTSMGMGQYELQYMEWL